MQQETFNKYQVNDA